MNLVTKTDLKKFIKLLSIGLKEGKIKELRTYTSATNYDETDVIKDWYVSLDFSFTCSDESIQQMVDEDVIDDEIKDMLNSLNK